MSNLDREFIRGAGAVAVMKLLERGEKYGYELVEELERRTDGLLALGQSTLYPMLYGLEAKKLIASRWDESGSRPRKYYRLTPTGRKKLAEDTKSWKQLASAMEALGLAIVRAMRAEPPSTCWVIGVPSEGTA